MHKHMQMAASGWRGSGSDRSRSMQRKVGNMNPFSPILLATLLMEDEGHHRSTSLSRHTHSRRLYARRSLILPSCTSSGSFPRCSCKAYPRCRRRLFDAMKEIQFDELWPAHFTCRLSEIPNQSEKKLPMHHILFMTNDSCVTNELTNTFQVNKVQENHF